MDNEEEDNNDDEDNDNGNETETFSLTSTAFNNTGNMPALYTCDSDGISPPLSWSGVPSGTQSFLLTVLDSDAENFVHWGVKNIPASTTSVAQDSAPSGGTQLPNEGGDSEWFGPCPPIADGAHTYVFTLYALSASSLSSTTVDDAITEAGSSTLGTAIISGEYDSN